MPAREKNLLCFNTTQFAIFSIIESHQPIIGLIILSFTAIISQGYIYKSNEDPTSFSGNTDTTLWPGLYMSPFADFSY